MDKERTYRKLIIRDDLTSFQVMVKETDLWVHAEKNLERETRELVLKYRAYIESYIERHPEFVKTLKPWYPTGPTPKIIMDMAEAGQRAGVGPMAAVAGVIAEYVGKDLLASSKEVIVENGGDIFVKLNRPFISSIYAGDSALSLKIGMRVDTAGKPVGVCTSSGTIGHSFSKGKSET